MTVKIGMGGSALDLSGARVWRHPANKIMVGTGTSAVEVWSASPYPATGTFNIVDGAALVVHDVFTHTIVEPGNYTVSFTPTSGASTIYQWYLNGVNAGVGVDPRSFTGLSVGDTINLKTIHTEALNLSGTWSIVQEEPLTPSDLPEELELSLAATEPYRVAFAGSSTTQGWGQPQYESYAHVFLTRLLRHVMDANASKMVVQSSGSVTRPSAKGFHFLNIGLGGTTSANYINSTRRSMLNTYAPQLMIHMIGSNDYAEQMPIATYKQNLRNQLQDQTTKHLLVQTYRRQDRADTGITWAMYGQALEEVAAEFPNTYFVDAGALWEQRRGGRTDWLQGDLIHTTWIGAQELSEALGDVMGLEMNSGQTVWAFEASQAGQVNDQIIPTPDSLVQSVALSPSSARGVKKATDGGVPVFTFNNSGARYADTPAFDSAFAMPMAFFVVVSTWGTQNTTQTPWFSRSVLGDDGWWWVWKEGTAYRAALNSAFSPAATISSAPTPRLVGVHMMPNNQSRIYVHSHNNTLLPPDTIDATLGPWMKSLRIGANSGGNNYISDRIREMRWETAPMNADEYMPQRMTELASKHGLTLV